MFSSKDFEKLWFLYQTEGVPEEESINSFCEKNGVPYEEFDKWFRKTHQAVGRVEIENIPDDEPMSSRRRGRKAEPEGIQVTIQTSDGLHLRKVGLSYQGLKSLVENRDAEIIHLGGQSTPKNVDVSVSLRRYAKLVNETIKTKDAIIISQITIAAAWIKKLVCKNKVVFSDIINKEQKVIEYLKLQRK